MAISYLSDLVNESKTRKVWMYNDEQADSKFFSEAMQEYCFSFYTIGTPASMNAFHQLSQKMLEVDQKNNAFINNIGTYYLIVKDDPKTALKYYNKVLKSDPKDYTAVKNCVILARKQNNVKLEKKFLAKLVECGTEKDKVTAQARLKQLDK
jgi:phosphoenolpyruvate carboxylase